MIAKEPEQLLKDLHLDVADSHRGHLKIFFGYAAGVGKTYAMLQAAHEIKKEGVDVAAGYIEPHRRMETNALLKGLEVLPPLIVKQHGIEVSELDLDAALQRRPDVLLVDELAHTNADGLRHKKRYQDIEELLDHGIHVYTTINVQHIESLMDKVASITHIHVQERVPDKVFDQADQIEMIDIEPDDLLERLSKGKIYQSEKIDAAKQHFFVKENLIALREIALRRCADQMNQKVDSAFHFLTGEHILVCISASISNAHVIRSAARMANAMHGRLTALYVEGTTIMEEDEKTREQLRQNFRLAQAFGAEIAIVQGVDLPEQIIEFARLSGVSKIIIGRTKRKSSVVGYRLGFVDKLILLAPEIELYVIPDTEQHQRQPHAFPIEGRDWLLTLVLLCFCTLIAAAFNVYKPNTTSIVLCYVIGSILLGDKTKHEFYLVLYAVCAAILFNYFFIPPYYELRIQEKSYVITLILLLCVSLMCSHRIAQSRNRARKAAKETFFANSLMEMSKILQVYEGEAFLQQSIALFTNIFRMPVAFITIKDNKMQFYIKEEYHQYLSILQKDEQAVICWVLQNRKRAGKTTNTLPGAKALYIPVLDKSHGYGCLALLGTKEAILDINEPVLIALIDQFMLRLSSPRS